MTSKVEEAFGFQLCRGKKAELTTKEFQAYQDFEAKALELADSKGISIRKHAIYVHMFSITYKQRHSGVEELENRLATLQLKLKINPKQVLSESMKFLNGDLGAQRQDSPAEVKVAHHSSQIAYQIPGLYLAKNQRFFDYVITYIDSTPSRDRKLKLEIKGIPTSNFSYMVNSSSSPSRVDIDLSASIQLKLF
jgi:hypothetical protein